MPEITSGKYVKTVCEFCGEKKNGTFFIHIMVGNILIK